MGTSQRLTVNNIRDVFRLLNEVRELGASPPAWRRHMLQGLRRMVGADKAHAGEAPIPCSATAPRFLGVVVDGVTDPKLLALYHTLIEQRDYADDPCVEAISELISGSFTRARQQMAEDRLWYRRRDVDAWRTLGCDYFIYSHQSLARRGCIHLIALNRDWGKPAFNERERKTVDLFHEELGRLWCDQTLDSKTDLSPRLRQTLGWLMEGISEKEIAAAMALSRFTVHDYVKALYRRFNVRGRAELLACMSRLSGCRAPRLSVEFRPEATGFCEMPNVPPATAGSRRLHNGTQDGNPAA